MNRMRSTFLALLAVLLTPAALRASDPPHNGTNNIQCLSCHKLHNAPGGTLTTAAGNANLCMTCHTTGSLGVGTPPSTAVGAPYSFTPNDQAVPGRGMPAGVAASGTSHRWNAGPSGRISVPSGKTNSSTGSLTPTGSFTGPYAKTYLITITAPGTASSATFQYQTSDPLTGTLGGLVTGLRASLTGTLLDAGISLKFADGTTGTSFATGDQWYLHVRTDLAVPTNANLRLENGGLMCSSCHNQHSQAANAFDPASRLLAAGSAGRHFQRIDNNQSQMCVDCHAPRNVTAKGGISHPVGSYANKLSKDQISGDWKGPSTALLDADGFVRCQSCHDVHKATTTANGLLLRAEVSSATAGVSPLCNDCHTYATVTTNKGVHFDTAKGVLWPGGKYGSPITTYPAFSYAADAGKRATCVNCHVPHGWPDSRDTTKHYAKLLVDEPSNLCLTCHSDVNTTTPNQLTPTGAVQLLIPDIQKEITKATHHPIERTSGRTVMCADCHNPHKAAAGSHTYGTTADQYRNQIMNGTTVQSGPLMGVDGVDVATWPTWLAPGTYSYSPQPTATKEYQVCFKCHTSYSFGTTAPSSGGGTSVGAFTMAASTTPQTWATGSGTASFTLNSNTVAGTTTSWTNANMKGRGIRRSGTTNNYIVDPSTAYNITSTSLRLLTNFLQNNTSGNYQTRPSAAITATNAVTGYGTSWVSSVVGQYIELIGSGTSSEITAWGSATGLTIAASTVAATPADFYLHPGAKFLSGSTTVTGSGTNWTAAMAGQAIRPEDGTGIYYIVAASPAPTATSLTLTTPYVGTTRYYRYSTATVTTTPVLSYTDLAQEFNPANRSAHPVVVPMNAQTGQVTPTGGLTVTLNPPWNTNKGSQTMMCSDCHNTDGTAAQGPHGSAAQFMLRSFGTGTPPPANWPDVTLSNARQTTTPTNQSWCNNCHPIQSSTNNVHSAGDHSSRKCYECHIVIPHGGKVSRLIATDTSNLPKRYAYLNDNTKIQLTQFIKTSSSNYNKDATGNCSAKCSSSAHPSTLTNSGIKETW
ncbi:cytochrome c3 family protein [Geothrix fuzhouensis]|uniref:cytochrome c3 family protein n=1 Tax=Geothrix fuzhouensis TaxID=2966451 RepID=UPI002148413F|nr:cytochrome c3 family protein [Geothrix fuzhouensis]